MRLCVGNHHAIMGVAWAFSLEFHSDESVFLSGRLHETCICMKRIHEPLFESCSSCTSSWRDFIKTRSGGK